MMVLYKEGYKEYMNDSTNINDIILFISHTTFFVLKIIQFKERETHVPGDHPEDLENTAVILSTIVLFTGVVKAQHMLKIYSTFGLLSELLVRSATRVIPFMVIFFAYNTLFAFELYILKSNKESASDLGNGMPSEGLKYMVGYFF